VRAGPRLAVGAMLACVPVLIGAGEAQAATTAALWHMEDTGRLVDSSGRGNDGTTTAVTSVASGAIGRAYHFNGQNSVASVPDAASLDPGTATLRITARVRFTVVPSRSVVDYDLVRKGLSGTAGGDWKMEIFPSVPGGSVGPAYCFFQDATRASASIRGTRNLADGIWHTISCVKTATSISVVVDGVARTKSVKLGAISNSKPVTIGAKPGGGDRYLGDMDEVSIQIG
jgi:Concanavalin A-like lectin/glucanases superfamily